MTQDKGSDAQSGRPSHVFGKQVKEVREGLRPKVSQVELARRLTELGIETHQVTVSRIETGDRDVSIDEAFAIAVALGASPLFLLSGGYTSESVAVTGRTSISPSLMYYWLRAERPPPGGDEATFFDNVPIEERLDRLGRGVEHLARSYQDLIDALKRKDRGATRDALGDLKDEIERQLAATEREERKQQRGGS